MSQTVEQKSDPNAFMQLMYEQNSDWDDVNRLQNTPVAVPNPVLNKEPDPSLPGQPRDATPKPER